jgi:hypothetical protein
MTVVTGTRLVLPGPHFGTIEASLISRASSGAKGAALAGLPISWTPPFFVVTTEAFLRFGERIAAGERPISLEFNSFVADLSQNVELLASSRSTRFIARSSAVHETLADRGRFESFRCGTTVSEILNAVGSVWKCFLDRRAGTAETSSIAAVVQAFIAPEVSGHLSNERRISKDARRWTCEFEDSLTLQTRRFAFRASTSKAGRNDLDLRCATAQGLEETIHRLAGVSTVKKQRSHFEWIWDGNRLWVVQCDIEEEFRGSRPKSAFSTGSVVPQPEALKVFVQWQTSEGHWKKINALRTFQKSGLQAGMVFVLEESHTLHELLKGNVTGELVADLEILLKAPIVIRTDVISSEPQLNLPRTDIVRDLRSAVNFLQTKSTELSALGPKYCFIVHRFITAIACAQAFTTPGVVS